eukprot:CAMPEP_0170639322 /NCGR_PEP_ID=MMETSP0224-20130122/39582_1 /TAXON_ID=285029 /ORGANISM="Togula jolla, Strain CCCM 725" /LENGTH=32 /DNA_ID= /DNA_START= /DNA_END= /DNA_ORIENTATION=
MQLEHGDKGRGAEHSRDELLEDLGDADDIAAS